MFVKSLEESLALSLVKGLMPLFAGTKVEVGIRRIMV
jgi:hypothetical protein